MANNKVENIFFVEKKENGECCVSKSYVMQPKIKFKGGSIKWFDDSKLIKSQS